MVEEGVLPLIPGAIGEDYGLVGLIWRNPSLINLHHDVNLFSQYLNLKMSLYGLPWLDTLLCFQFRVCYRFV